MAGKTGFLAAALVLSLALGISAYASDADSSSWDDGGMNGNPARSYYDQGMEAFKQGDYSTAYNFFSRAVQGDKRNPEALHMLAYAQLKLGMIDESLGTYRRALAVRPKFPEAREHLAGAYLQAAMREVKALKSYGADGQESLANLKKAFQEAAANLE